MPLGKSWATPFSLVYTAVLSQEIFFLKDKLRKWTTVYYRLLCQDYGTSSVVMDSLVYLEKKSFLSEAKDLDSLCVMYIHSLLSDVRRIRQLRAGLETFIEQLCSKTFSLLLRNLIFAGNIKAWAIKYIYFWGDKNTHMSGHILFAPVKTT